MTRQPAAFVPGTWRRAKIARRDMALHNGAMSDVTHILAQIEAGDPSAAELLLPLVYDELRKLAAAKLAQEKPGQRIQELPNCVGGESCVIKCCWHGGVGWCPILRFAPLRSRWPGGRFRYSPSHRSLLSGDVRHPELVS